MMKSALAIVVLLGAVFLDSTNGRYRPKKLHEVVKQKLKKLKSASGKIELINTGSGMINRLFESDIMVSPDELRILRNGKTPKGWQMKYKKSQRISKRNAMRNRGLIWRTKRIPYVLSSEIQSAGTSEIMSAINIFHQKTCVRWEPKTAADTKYVNIVKKDGCWSFVGKTTGVGAQELSVGDGCNHVPTILHEMMHATGFQHEQSRPDRDQYVVINSANIMDGQAHNFNKQTIENSEILGDYDYSSLMHYGRTDFSKNGLPTIQAKNDPNKVLGQDNGLTQLDLDKIKALYDCTSGSSPWSSWSAYGPCHVDENSKCVKVKQRFCTVESIASCPGSNSDGVQQESASCSSCVMNGQWGMWSNWGSCSKSCASGSQQRSRACDSPAPSNGGSNCVGSTTETQACNTQTCSTNNQNSHSCDFESYDMCGWNNEYNNPQDSQYNYYDWVQTDAPSHSSTTGPAADHSPAGTHYMVIRSGNFNAGSLGAMFRSGFNPTSTACLDFWFHMKGSNMGSLKVYTRDDTTGVKTNIWTVSGDQGSDWHNEKLTLSSPQTFSIIFESVRGNGANSDIALDDVKVTNQECSY